MAFVQNFYLLIGRVAASGSKVTMFLLCCALSLLASCTNAQSFDDLIIAATNNNEDNIYDKALRSDILPLDSLEDYQLGLGSNRAVSTFQHIITLKA